MAPVVYVLVPVTLILPVAAVLDIPPVDLIYKFPVALKLKSAAFDISSINPFADMVRSPALVKISLVELVFNLTVPSMVPVLPLASVRFTLFAFTLIPSVSILLDATEKVPVTVMREGLPEPERIQFPLIVKLPKLIVGTAVMAADWSAGMVTRSPGAGAPLGLQLPAVVQTPPVVGTHDLGVCPKAALAKNKFTITKAMVSMRYLLKDVLMIGLFAVRLGFVAGTAIRFAVCAMGFVDCSL